MPDLLAALPIPLADQIACVEREISMRVAVFGRRVADGKMKQATADLEIARRIAQEEKHQLAHVAVLNDATSNAHDSTRVGCCICRSSRCFRLFRREIKRNVRTLRESRARIRKCKQSIFALAVRFEAKFLAETLQFGTT